MRKIIAISCLCLLGLLLSAGSAIADPITRDGNIYMNSSEHIYMGTWTESGSPTIKVTTNASVDVYVLTTLQYSGYPESFTYTKAWENTKSVDSKIKVESGESYYLIIDNMDNGRSTDATPKGDVEFSATYPNYLDRFSKEVEDLAWTGFWVCMGPIIIAVIVLVIIIIIVIYLVVKKKKPEQQQPQYQQQPYQQQPQYQQQPYQQQYQQQPQYQPPPPSPYEPPPPPPQ